MSKRKPDGYWQDKKNIVLEAKRVMQERNVNIVPSVNKLIKFGEGSLSAAIYNCYGGIEKFREVLGQDGRLDRTKKWNNSTIEAHANLLVKEHGFLPNSQYLQQNGESGFVSVVALKYPKGRLGLEKNLGLVSNPKLLSRESMNLRDREWIKEEAKRIMVALKSDYLPSVSVLRENGYHNFYYAVKKYHGGLPKVRREFLGQEKINGENVRDVRYKELNYCLELSKEIISKYSLANLPSHGSLVYMGEGRLAQAIIDYHGGFSIMRTKLGLNEDLNFRVGHREEELVLESKKVIVKHKLNKLPAHRKLFYMGYKQLAASIVNSGVGFNRLRELLGEKNIRVRRNSWQSIEYTIDKAKEAMTKYSWNELPSADVLSSHGYSSLGSSITTHHGGFIEFRRVMGEKCGIGIRQGNAACILEGYVNG